jgi:hypothetical protein
VHARELSVGFHPLHSRPKEENNTTKCLYPTLIYNFITILIIRIKVAKENALYNCLSLDSSLTKLYSSKDISLELIKPSLIYKTDSIRIINILDNIDIDLILKEREEDLELVNKEASTSKRPRTPSSTFNNLVLSSNPRAKKK